MEPIATTRRQLFPEARDDAPLSAHRPPRILFSARRWYGAIWLMVCVGLIGIAVQLIGSWTSPEAVNAALGGTGVTYDSDGDPNVLAGTWLQRLMWGAFISAAITYCLLRLSIQLSGRRSRHDAWANYGVQRGLRPFERSEIAGTSLRVFEDGRDRDWSGMLTGPLVGGAEVVVGATAWTTGSGKSQERHHIRFVYLRLPDAVAELFPGTSLSRFLRGISDVTVHPPAYRELRFESSTLDDACEIQVAGEPGDVRWHELFDPITLLGLDQLYDGQWQHVGRHVAFVAGGNVHSRVPVELMDTLCLTAAFMYGRFLAAAMGDVERDQLAG
jgi:hypothetical protein